MQAGARPAWGNQIAQRRLTTTRPESTASTSVLPLGISQVVNAQGRPLDRVTRRFFEPRFGSDFAGVVVHDGPGAAASAAAMNARAYTVGSHIVFGAGEFSPATSSGRALLAHELAHTLQDSAGPLTIRRACAGESFYQSSPGYCRDDDFSPITHSGTTCYRQIPSRASGFECPPSQHFCFKPDGACEESPDRASIADGKDANGACSWNWFCVAQHVAADFLPAFGVQTGLFQLLQNVGTFGQIGGTLGEIGGELFDAGEDMYETGKGVYEIGEDLLDMLGLGDQ